MHSKGIMHRDIKPGNILINEQNYKIKIIDFGFATYKNVEFLFPMCGTPGYVAPEIFNVKENS